MIYAKYLLVQPFNQQYSCIFVTEVESQASEHTCSQQSISSNTDAVEDEVKCACGSNEVATKLIYVLLRS